MVFVPSDITYHGFEPRTIDGVRKSVIINYVTNEWRAREQLAYPDRPDQELIDISGQSQAPSTGSRPVGRAALSDDLVAGVLEAATSTVSR